MGNFIPKKKKRKESLTNKKKFYSYSMHTFVVIAGKTVNTNNLPSFKVFLKIILKSVSKKKKKLPNEKISVNWDSNLVNNKKRLDNIVFDFSSINTLSFHWKLAKFITNSHNMNFKHMADVF